MVWPAMASCGKGVIYRKHIHSICARAQIKETALQKNIIAFEEIRISIKLKRKNYLLL